MRQQTVMVAMWAIVATCVIIGQGASTAETTVLVLGDSLSSGYGLRRGTGWVELTSARLSSRDSATKIVNRSRAGLEASTAKYFVRNAVIETQPDVIVLAVGGNDALRMASPDVLASNLSEIADAATRTGADVLMLAVRLPPIYPAEYTIQVLRTFERVAAEADVHIIEMIPRELYGRVDLMQPDGLHPAESVQAVIGDRVSVALEQILEPHAHRWR